MTSPVTSFANAVAAYNRAVKGGEGTTNARDGGAEQTFAGMVKTVVHGAIDASETGEKLSVAGVNGMVDLNQVVTAVAEAEIALNTVVAVRDKVIEAYKDIIRMPM